MSTPTRSQVHVNRPLTNISVSYQQSADAFVASRVFPVIPVDKQSDQYFVFNRSDQMRDEMRKRAPGTESAGGGYTISTDSYFCDVYAFHKDIDDQTRANYDTPLNADREAAQYVTNKYLISREAIWAAANFTTSKWAQDVTGVASGTPGASEVLRWNVTNSTPIADIQKWKTTMLERTGYEPNVLTLGRPVWDVLKNHPDILDRVRYGGSNGSPAMGTRQLIAGLFEVDEILVMNAIKSSDAEPGPANSSAVSAFIGTGKAALLTYRPPSPGLMTPSAGYTFAWNGLLGASSYGSAISTFRMEEIKSDRVEIEAAYAHKIVGSDLGTYFTTVIT